MKKQIINALSKFSFGILFLIATVAVQAQSPAPVKENPLEVKYMGTQEDMIVFNVSYKNPSGEKFSIIVKDQEGSQLYQVVYNEKSFNKQFRLPSADKNKVTFIIRNNKEADIAKSFAINVNSHFVEDFAVKKID
ncbi:MAG TPA: hypothetical protein VK563_08655 [Puia sp.]|nr:hypothetical protein [Puia sp.]